MTSVLFTIIMGNLESGHVRVSDSWNPQELRDAVGEIIGISRKIQNWNIFYSDEKLPKKGEIGFLTKIISYEKGFSIRVVPDYNEKPESDEPTTLQYPPHWTRRLSSTCDKVLLDKDSPEYLYATSGFVFKNIAGVFRIQSYHVYEAHMVRRNQRLAQGRSLTTKILYHGSRATERVLHGGFDICYASRSGLLGAGIYFAHTSAYSASYSSGSVDFPENRSMLVCAVIVGTSHIGSHRTNHPPEGFDSNCSPESRIYCIFNNADAVPLYEIAFKEK